MVTFLELRNSIIEMEFGLRQLNLFIRKLNI